MSMDGLWQMVERSGLVAMPVPSRGVILVGPDITIDCSDIASVQEVLVDTASKDTFRGERLQEPTIVSHTAITLKNGQVKRTEVAYREVVNAWLGWPP